MSTTTAHDERFVLTEWERARVRDLKDECDRQGVAHRSLFELAKYVLVVQSSVKGHTEENEKRRLSLAFERIKARRDWERKVGVDKIDADKALRKCPEVAPGFLIFDFDTDLEGRNIIAFSKLHTNAEFVKEHKAESYAAMLHLYDLAVADMSVARRGIAVAAMAPEEKQQDENMPPKTGTLSYVRSMLALKDLLKPIHNAKIKCIYSVAPPALRVLFQVILNILPRKLRDRLQTFPKQADLEKKLRRSRKQNRTLEEWIAEQTAIYNETEEKLSL